MASRAVGCFVAWLGLLLESSIDVESSKGTVLNSRNYFWVGATVEGGGDTGDKVIGQIHWSIKLVVQKIITADYLRIAPAGKLRNLHDFRCFDEVFHLTELLLQEVRLGRIHIGEMPELGLDEDYF